MRLVLAAAGAALLSGGLALAAEIHDWSDEVEYAEAYPQSQAICRRLKSLGIPAADRPAPAEAARLKGCDSEALYYGVGRPADPVLARKCAIAEIEAPPEGGVGYFAGSNILMMVYANGRGAARNLDLATRLACSEEGAPAEIDGRVLGLQALKSQPQDEPFDWCDHVTSGLNGGACAAHAARVDGARRAETLARMNRTWSPAAKQAFVPLQGALDAFARARGESETDMSGTLRAALAIGAEEEAREGFMATLQHLEAGKGAPSVKGGLAAADAQLNAAWRRVMSADSETRLGWGTVTPDDIRTTQRAWLRYRDAFIAFAKVRYPAVPSDALAAWLTDQRLATLLEFVEGE